MVIGKKYTETIYVCRISSFGAKLEVALSFDKSSSEEHLLIYVNDNKAKELYIGQAINVVIILEDAS